MLQPSLQLLLVAVLSMLPEQPHAPTGIAASTTVTLVWEPPPDGGAPIVAYAISGGLAGGPVRPIYDPLLAGDAGDPYRRELTVRGLQPSTAYAFRLCAVNREGRSAWSEPARFDTKPPLVRVSGVSPMAGPRALWAVSMDTRSRRQPHAWFPRHAPKQPAALGEAGLCTCSLGAGPCGQH